MFVIKAKQAGFPVVAERVKHEVSAKVITHALLIRGYTVNCNGVIFTAVNGKVYAVDTRPVIDMEV